MIRRPLAHGHRSLRPHPRRGERGAQLLEAALALPIFFLLIFGFIDIGLGVFQTSQATSAAADGARAGMVRFKAADVTSSTDRAAIEAAIAARLPRQPASVAVRCLKPDNSVVVCANANANTDRIEVKVNWTYRPISPFGHLVPVQTLTGIARMALVDQPTTPAATSSTTTTPTTTSTSTTSTTSSTTTSSIITTTTLPPTCAVVSMTATPNPVQRKNDGRLYNSVSIAVVTNGSPQCTGLRLEFTPTVIRNLSMSQQSSTLWTVTINKDSYNWTAGQQTMTVLRSTIPIASGVVLTVVN